MAAGYVDDHRVILYRDGAAARDITAFCGDLTAKDDLDALSVEVTFHIFKSVWDKYTPALNLAPGDKIRIVNHGNTVFSGVIVTVTLDGTEMRLRSVAVLHPMKVRYAYVNWGKVALFGRNGLPLAPFALEG